jgi:hypothetical protein
MYKKNKDARMGIDLGSAAKFVQDTLLSPIEKIVGGITSSIVGNLPLNTTSVAKSTAETLFNIGASYDSISSISAAKTDSIISGAPDEFYAFAGKNVSRASGVDIAKLRGLQQETSQAYINEINPSTKLARVQEERADIFISVL